MVAYLYGSLYIFGYVDYASSHKIRYELSWTNEDRGYSYYLTGYGRF